MREYVESLTVGDVTGYFRETLYGAGSPGADIDAFPGQRYFDTSAQAEWVCISRVSNKTAWRKSGGSGGGGLPEHTAADEGKFLRIVGGSPAWVALINGEEVKF